jgi:hypothetical protein
VNKFKNKLFLNSFMLVINPLLLYLLIIIIYLFFFVYLFADPILCQDIDPVEVTGVQQSTVTPNISETPQLLLDPEINANDRLRELKVLWESDVKEAYLANKQYIYWHDLYAKATQRPVRNYEFEDVLYRHLKRPLQGCKHYFQKIRITEEGIKKLHPRFISPLPKQWYE